MASKLDQACAIIQQRQPFQLVNFDTHSRRRLSIARNDGRYDVVYRSPSGIVLKSSQSSCTLAQLRALVHQYIPKEDLSSVGMLFGNYGIAI